MPYGVYINGYRCSDLNEDGTEVQTNKIFVGGLSQSTSKEALKGYFAKYGVVVQCDVKKDRTTGYGFVHFDGPQSVERVCDGSMHQLHGRWMEVRKAVPAQPKNAQVSVPARAQRSFSPAAGSRAMRDALSKGMAGRGPKRRSRSRRRSPSSSSSSSSSSPKPARKKRRSRSRSVRSCSSSSSSVKVMGGAKEAAAAAVLAKEPAASNPDVDKAKAAALQRLMGLKSVEPKELRMKHWRALLREWHPDKNPERVEIATAVFQFLQKGKPMLESS